MWVWPALGFACGFSLAILGPYLWAVSALVSVIFSSEGQRAPTLVAVGLGTVAALGLLAAVSDVSQASHFRLGP